MLKIVNASVIVFSFNILALSFNIKAYQTLVFKIFQTSSYVKQAPFNVFARAKFSTCNQIYLEDCVQCIAKHQIRVLL